MARMSIFEQDVDVFVWIIKYLAVLVLTTAFSPMHVRDVSPYSDPISMMEHVPSLSTLSMTAERKDNQY